RGFHNPNHAQPLTPRLHGGPDTGRPESEQISKTVSAPRFKRDATFRSGLLTPRQIKSKRNRGAGDRGPQGLGRWSEEKPSSIHAPNPRATSAGTIEMPDFDHSIRPFTRSLIPC